MTSFTATGVPPSVAIVVSENVNDLLAVQDKGDVGCGTSFFFAEGRQKNRHKISNFKFLWIVSRDRHS